MNISDFYEVDLVSGEKTEKARPETKTIDDVKRVISKHSGNPAGESAVASFIKMYVLGVKWDNFERYKAWQAQCKKVQAWNDNRKEDEDGNLPDPMPLPVEPDPLPDKSAELKELQWKARRDWLHNNAKVTVNGKIFDADERSIYRMHQGVREQAGQEMALWVLADSPAGVPTEIPYADLVKAYELARKQFPTMHLR